MHRGSLGIRRRAPNSSPWSRKELLPPRNGNYFDHAKNIVTSKFAANYDVELTPMAKPIRKPRYASRAHSGQGVSESQRPQVRTKFRIAAVYAFVCVFCASASGGGYVIATVNSTSAQRSA